MSSDQAQKTAPVSIDKLNRADMPAAIASTWEPAKSTRRFSTEEIPGSSGDGSNRGSISTFGDKTNKLTARNSDKSITGKKTSVSVGDDSKMNSGPKRQPEKRTRMSAFGDRTNELSARKCNESNKSSSTGKKCSIM